MTVKPLKNQADKRPVRLPLVAQSVWLPWATPQVALQRHSQLQPAIRVLPQRCRSRRHRIQASLRVGRPCQMATFLVPRSRAVHSRVAQAALRAVLFLAVHSRVAQVALRAVRFQVAH